MRKVRVGNNQSIYDIAVQEYGSLDAVGFIMADNALAVTSKLVPGTLLLVRDTPLDAVTVRQLRARGVFPAAGDAYLIEEWDNIKDDNGNVAAVLVRDGLSTVLANVNAFSYIDEDDGAQEVTANARPTHIELVDGKLLMSSRISGVFIYDNLDVPVYDDKLDNAISSLISDTCYYHGLVTGDKLVVGTDIGASVGAWAGELTAFTDLFTGIAVRQGVTVGGVAYMATDAGVKFYDGTSVGTWDTTKGLPTNDIRHVYVDSRGVIWCCTLSDGLVRILPNEDVIINDTNGLLAPSDRPTAIAEDGYGRMYVSFYGDGTRSYLAIIDELGNWTVLDSNDGILPTSTIICMDVDVYNNIYVGTNALGAYYWNRHPILNS